MMQFTSGKIFGRMSLLAFIALFLPGCSRLGIGDTPERQYFLLSAAGPAPARSGLGIGVGPVTLAPFLTERQNLQFQTSANRLTFSQQHLWAGDLEDEFKRVLTTNLGRRLGTGNLKQYPWQNENELDYQVTVEVARFQGAPNGESVLEAAWRAYKLPSGRLVASRNTTLKDDLRSDGFEELAASQSRLVDRLAVIIGNALELKELSDVN